MQTDFGCISFHLGCFISLYSKLIGWVVEGGKYAAVRGDQPVLMVVPLQETEIHLLEKYFVLYLKTLIGLLYFVLML